MELTMLEFAEKLLRQIRQLQADAQHIIVSGSIKDMEQYRHMMGRLEGLRFAEQAITDSLSKNPHDD
jgi:hypothetical protein